MSEFSDAFGRAISVGDEVICIANTNTTQTFVKGIVVNFVGKCVNVRIDLVSDLYSEEYVPKFGDEKRICLSHRVAKI